MKSLNLLNLDKNAKTIKGQKYGYKTAVIYLSPYTLSYIIFKQDKKAFQQALKTRYNLDYSINKIELALKNLNSCPFARNCIRGCLNTSGNGRYDHVQFWRAVKTAFYALNRQSFNQAIIHELKLIKKRIPENLAFRFNGTSDFWDAEIVQQALDLGDISVYDYTKDISKFTGNAISQYSLTYSIQDHKSFKAWQSVKNESNCALVTLKGVDDPILKSPIFSDYALIEGDNSDLRFLDPQIKAIVVLKAKGKARKDAGKFIVNNWNAQELSK